MFSEPADVNGACNARLYIADNFGDNHATMVCQLPSGHKGKHEEEYEAGVGNRVVVRWDEDGREQNGK